ncbi:cation:proton antiporter [Flavobacterium amniphilum]|uniref:cation:proton antiporter n=1 Tax=Flavobacterium amniphilum TaxID=1834035 RepID=UPI00202A4316|nr:cation:proton antiporter [Flavobacterium amniphilum]MCL9805449.1 cation:proton antiporter [Flavobacterium amniphilum]
MGKFKNSFFYVGVIGAFSALMYWIIIYGTKLEEGKNIKAVVSNQSQWSSFTEALTHNFEHPLAVLLAQIVTIVMVAKLFGWICTKIGQPTVIGEMIAGIVLGPSLVGMYFPEFSAVFFPEESLGNLKFLSQIGLILFMFIVGMELDIKILKNKAHDAVVISHASIIIPFALGMGLAYFIYHSFAPEGVQFLSFALFMGIAMSITAFPVLARIVQERNLNKTKLGTVAITCAAADDITAWCILAAVIAIVKAGSVVSSFYTIFLAAVYVLAMIKVVRPFLKRVGDLHATKDNMSKPVVAIFFLTLIISAYATEVIGIHALFGAFMTGAIMPDNMRFRNLFIEKIEDVALVLLLPLFFVFTGLRTQIGLLNDGNLWKITGLIILVAVVGKFFGSALAAKFVGQNWKDSLSIGALMNTRGLMELVVLNIGYDLGVLTPEVFSMMVIMALVTTFMTGPALDLINWAFKSKTAEIPVEVKETSKYKILFSFGTPESGRTLLKLANNLTKKLNNNAVLTGMHLTPVEEMHHYDTDQYETDSFKEVVEESETLNRKITTLFKVSTDIDTDITAVANKGDYDLLLIGLGESIYQGTLLGKVLGFTTRIINPEKLINTVTGKENLFDNSFFDERTRFILSKANIPVGILIDKDFSKTERIFIPVFDANDSFLINYAQKLIHNSGAQIVILDAAGQIKNNAEIKEKIRAIEQNAPNHITLQNQRAVEKDFLTGQDLMIISIDSWKKLIESKSMWLPDIPSTLIISDKTS